MKEELKIGIFNYSGDKIEIMSIEPKKILEIISEENPLIVRYKYLNYIWIPTTSITSIFYRTITDFKNYFNLSNYVK